jgi:hypothetical protein
MRHLSFAYLRLTAPIQGWYDWAIRSRLEPVGLEVLSSVLILDSI